MLSTKDLKYQMVGRRTEKLTERFVHPYKIKKIVFLVHRPSHATTYCSTYGSAFVL